MPSLWVLNWQVGIPTCIFTIMWLAILAFNTFSFVKLGFCLLLGAVVAWYYLTRPGPWSRYVSVLRALFYGGLVTFIAGVMVFPVLKRVQYELSKPPLMFNSNEDLRYHSVRKFVDPPIQGYLEHLPPDYNENPKKTYPMIVFLHGLAEYGNGDDKIYRAAELGAPREVEKLGKLCVTKSDGTEECFIVITPQKDDKGEWTVDVQRNFWHYILNGPNNYRYDPDRIYLTGLSLGAHGVWVWAHSDEPDAARLAGIIPVSGRGKMTINACRLEENGINLWAFHGAEDPILPPPVAMLEYNALERCPEVTGAEHTWTNVPDVGHWMYEPIYINDHHMFNPNIYEWMAETRKKYRPDCPSPDTSE